MPVLLCNVTCDSHIPKYGKSGECFAFVVLLIRTYEYVNMYMDTVSGPYVADVND